MAKKTLPKPPQFEANIPVLLIPKPEEYGASSERVKIVREHRRQINDFVASYKFYRILAIIMLLIFSITTFWIIDKDYEQLFAIFVVATFALLICLDYYLKFYVRTKREKFKDVNAYETAYKQSIKVYEQEMIVYNKLLEEYEKALKEHKIRVEEINIEIRKELEYRKRLKKDFWVSLSGREFEVEVAELFRKIYPSHYVELTRASHDGGVDIRIRSVGIIIQCKAHKTPIGVSILRELLGSLVSDKTRPFKAILVTTNGVTSGAKEFIKNKSIEVWDVYELMRWHKNYPVINRNYKNLTVEDLTI